MLFGSTILLTQKVSVANQHWLNINAFAIHLDQLLNHHLTMQPQSMSTRRPVPLQYRMASILLRSSPAIRKL